MPPEDLKPYENLSSRQRKELKMSRRFDYVKYDPEATLSQESAKTFCQELEDFIETLKDGRAKSLAITHLEITYMWIGKALRDECIARNPETPDVPERTKG